MKKAEVVTIPAEKGVPKVEIRKTSRGKSAKPVRTVIVGDEWAEEPVKKPEKKQTNGAGVREKSAAKGDEATAAEAGKPAGTENVRKSGSQAKARAKNAKADRGKAGTGNAKRAKARKPNEKLTPASIYRKMLAFGKSYQIENEQDFQEAARIFADEAGLIDQMRDQIAEEGLTVMKTYKTGDVPVAHPLLSELPRHVESANKCLATIGNMVSERGARVEKAARDLDAFRLHTAR